MEYQNQIKWKRWTANPKPTSSPRIDDAYEILVLVFLLPFFGFWRLGDGTSAPENLLAHITYYYAYSFPLDWVCNWNWGRRRGQGQGQGRGLGLGPT